ncbi:superfamily II DNA or RNA helicase [Sporosarcina luteola]|nr:superfamily II DNA or RNA helicase [Sporosarcina luteola]
MDFQDQFNKVVAECDALRRENDFLKRVIRHQLHSTPVTNHFNTPVITTNESSIYEKIQLFNSLFKGQTEFFAKRWESKSGKSGYSPVCTNDWKPGVCQKPKLKCSDCSVRNLIRLTDQDIYDHLCGKQTVGLYPLLRDNSCWFMAIDLDKGTWQEDVLALTDVCKAVNMPHSIERSRSGNGAHVWLFFQNQIPAAIARRLGQALLDKTNISLSSFDRMFPNQDELPAKGFGNLIALPLQGRARKEKNSLFVDDSFHPYPDQWLYLSTVGKLDKKEVEQLIHKLTIPDIAAQEGIKTEVRENTVVSNGGGVRALWKNGIHIEKSCLSSLLTKQLEEATSFSNPEYYRLQAKRYSTYGVPKRIECADQNDVHLIMPRGSLDLVKESIDSYGLELRLEDFRNEGTPIHVGFCGELRLQQQEAVHQMMKHEHGVILAATGFGKTVTAAGLIAERKINTLIIVHRKHLMDQWMEQLSIFLGIEKSEIGQIGAGKRRPTGIIDIAMIQSLSKEDGVDSVVAQYGQVIVDECHHLSAVSFERVMKQIRAKYVYGLTATLSRKDGLHPIITMQCGPVIYKTDAKVQAKIRSFNHRVIQRNTRFKSKAEHYLEICNKLIEDRARNELLFNDVLLELEEGRAPIILTERVQHAEVLYDQFKGFVKNIIFLHGSMKKKEQEKELDKLRLLSGKDEFLIIATGKYVGEGFDFPRLDTLFLAMPISWKGILQQYVGRLHRDHPEKMEVRVFDYLDHYVPMLVKMHEKRQKGFASMGYMTGNSASGEDAEQMQLF